MPDKSWMELHDDMRRLEDKLTSAENEVSSLALERDQLKDKLATNMNWEFLWTTDGWGCQRTTAEPGAYVGVEVIVQGLPSTFVATTYIG